MCSTYIDMIDLDCLQKEALAKYDRNKCQQIYTPSWLLEKHYSPGVRIYNWSEERHKFQHPEYFKPFPVSTFTRDYKNRACESQAIDPGTRGAAAVYNQRGAVPNNLFFRHHWKRYDCNNVTWYDEVYNGRRFTDDNGQHKFPDVRHWDLSDDEWKPEQSDFPLQGEATNWGLVDKKRELWNRMNQDSNRPFESIYHRSYNCLHDLPHCGLTLTRYSTPREISFKTAQVDHINWDTDFARGKHPERLWHYEKSSGLCEPRYPPKPLYD